MTTKLSPSDLAFLHSVGIAADDEPLEIYLWRKFVGRLPNPEYTNDSPPASMTTEQLGQALLKTVRQMSPEEKAKVRKEFRPKIVAARLSHDKEIKRLARRIAKHQAPEMDGTVRLLQEWGIPVTRENYLLLAFAGHPPEEPLDGEIEAELPLELQMADINNAPSAGDCGEPSHMTFQGFPLCARCGRSTRNMNDLVCAPCRNRTRLVLTEADRKWLREIRIAR